MCIINSNHNRRIMEGKVQYFEWNSSHERPMVKQDHKHQLIVMQTGSLQLIVIVKFLTPFYVL